MNFHSASRRVCNRRWFLKTAALASAAHPNVPAPLGFQSHELPKTANGGTDPYPIPLAGQDR